MRFRYFIYILLFLTLSCVKEQEALVPEGTVTATIPYTAVVQGSQLTRASISGAFGTGSYIFQTGDRLYVVDTDTDGTNLWGVLTLIDGANSGSGTFDGTLNYKEGFRPTDGTALSATLVGPDAAAGFYSISGEKVTGPTYPSSIPYEQGGLAEYVKKYSHFTSSSTFGAKTFTLTQQTVFLNFSIKNIDKNALEPEQSTATVSIKKGGSPVRSFTGIPLGGGSYFANAHFVGVLALTDDISSGQIFVENSTPISCGAPFSDHLTLEANNYYNVSRSCVGPWDGFTIQATTTNTRITFKHDNIEYSIDGGSHWNAATKGSPIPATEDPALSNGEEMWVRGSNTNYKNDGGDQYGTPGGNPIFTATEKCFISGNIMSLLADKDNLVESAFQGAFSLGSSTAVDYIDIDPNNPLILPATALAEKCYMQMFRNCTSLTTAPKFRAETVAFRSCYNMFRQCSNLTNVSGIELPAMTLAQDCYRELFRACSNLTYTPVFPAAELVKTCYQQMLADCAALKSVVCLATNISASDCVLNWFQGVSDVGTFYCDPSMTTKWTSKIKAGWTVTPYTPPAP